MNKMIDLKGMKLCLLFSVILLSFEASSQQIIVLGVAQDGGFPHIGCQNECQQAHQDPSMARFVTSLALVDSVSKKWWLFEATPDMDVQLQYFQELTEGAYPYLPEGIFLTHAHIGHYTGLMYLGREALHAFNVQVYGLPRLMTFLNRNGPWDQLVKLRNIETNPMRDNVPVMITNEIAVVAKKVPHRDEYSETAGFFIYTPGKTFLFIPDIDKWKKWDKSIVKEVRSVDHAFLDATFYADGELPNRAIDEVPHPFMTETMELFKNESLLTKGIIKFIHFNHTNPMLFDESKRQEVRNKGFGIAEQGKTYQ